MLVFIHLDDGIESFFEGLAVSGEADHGEYDVGAGIGAVVVRTDSVDFRGVAGVDVVAGCRTCVAGEDGEGGARYAEGRTAVIGVSGLIVSRLIWRERKYIRREAVLCRGGAGG